MYGNMKDKLAAHNNAGKTSPAVTAPMANAYPQRPTSLPDRPTNLPDPPWHLLVALGYSYENRNGKWASKTEKRRTRILEKTKAALANRSKLSQHRERIATYTQLAS
ncbi:hypothetical protein DY000_02040405 [Brassica cretica]|uniref:CG-1 domain-containing protein n=1 Tax=Brassica cretica TaxID=69181 RepID=A0ABQ7BBJ1_BRACR|nr:hypothetical protein DY000_02040405 [Brassica cretica]